MKLALYMDPPYIGGAERHFADLCEGLLADGETSLEIVCPDGPLPPYLAERLGGAVPVHALSPRPDYGDSLVANVARSRAAFRELRGAFARLDPDLIHIHNGGYPASHTARVAVFAHSAPRVMTVNNRARAREGVRRVYRLVDWRVWRTLRGVITPSRATADRLIDARDCPPELVTVVPYGIDPPRASEEELLAAREEIGAGERFVVGMLAAPSDHPDVAYKGHNVVVEALGILGRSDILAVMAGHDPGLELRKRAADLGVSESVRVLAGMRPAAPLIASFDALVVPSTQNEALPLVILEAMASSKPVLASRLAGIPEAVADDVNGFLFEPGDAAALAGLIGRLANDRALAAIVGAGARETYERRFTVAAMTADTLDVYRRALEGRARK